MKQPAGPYTSGPYTANVVHVSGAPTGIRVAVPGSTVLTGFLEATHPLELSELLSTLVRSKPFALAHVESSGFGRPRTGWVLDTRTPRRFKVGSAATKRAAEGDVRLLLVAVELYARGVLCPVDGQTDDVPDWVAPLREAHTTAVKTMKTIGVEPFEAVEPVPRGRRFPDGRFESPGGRAVVEGMNGPGGPALNPVVQVNNASLSRLLSVSLPPERARLLEAVLYRDTFTLPALDGRPVEREAWSATWDGEAMQLTAEGHAVTAKRSALLAILELDARAILAPFEHLPVTPAEPLQEGCVPAWVGRLRRLHTQACVEVRETYVRIVNAGDNG